MWDDAQESDLGKRAHRHISTARMPQSTDCVAGTELSWLRLRQNYGACMHCTYEVQSEDSAIWYLPFRCVRVKTFVGVLASEVCDIEVSWQMCGHTRAACQARSVTLIILHPKQYDRVPGHSFYELRCAHLQAWSARLRTLNASCLRSGPRV